MAKSQKKNSREAKKPKAVVKKAVVPVTVFDDSRSLPKKKPSARPPS